MTLAAHHVFPDVTLADLLQEIEREQASRHTTYPRMIDKGNLLPEEAERQHRLAAAWREDLARMDHCWIRAPGTPPSAPRHGFAWAERRRALLRELDYRRRIYPRWIAGDRLTAEAAEHRLRCLSALLAIYEDGWDWRASNGERTRFGLIDAPPPVLQARHEWDSLRAEIDARTNETRDGTAQKEMAL